jgi:hypothetical protein
MSDLGKVSKLDKLKQQEAALKDKIKSIRTAQAKAIQKQEIKRNSLITAAVFSLLPDRPDIHRLLAAALLEQVKPEERDLVADLLIDDTATHSPHSNGFGIAALDPSPPVAPQDIHFTEQFTTEGAL